jgi:hypothetical protein
VSFQIIEINRAGADGRFAEHWSSADLPGMLRQLSAPAESAALRLTDPHLLKGNPMATDVQTRSLPGLTGARRGALLAYRWLLLAFLLAGGVQIFLAGLGVFSVTGHGASADSAFSAHRGLGFAMGGAAVIILVLALLARPGVLPLTLAGVLVVQTFLLQSLLAGLADNVALYGGLHALNGLLALANAGFLYASARRWRA